MRLPSLKPPNLNMGCLGVAFGLVIFWTFIIATIVKNWNGILLAMKSLF